MGIFEYPNKFRVEIEEKQREIEKLEKEVKKIPKTLTSEDKKRRDDETERIRRKLVFEFFQELHPEHREMTEEEYQDYIQIFTSKEKPCKKGYSILSYINKDNPYDPNPSTSTA